MQGNTRDLIETQSFWDPYVVQFDHALQSLAERAHQSDPQLTWRSGRIHTGYTPFSWYGSATPREPSAEEALIIQIECNRPGGVESTEAVCHAYIIDGESGLDSEHPGVILELSAPAAEGAALIQEWMETAYRWLEGETERILAALASL